MKTFVKIFLLVLILLVVASVVFAAPAKEPVTLTSTRYKDLLILKADKNYIGCTVEVHDSHGDVITSRPLTKRKMIIDFYDIPYGAYTICVVKDNKTQEFQYVKEHDSEILN